MGERAPRVTVFVPVWNRAQVLRECLQSVLAQSYADFELLVIPGAGHGAGGAYGEHKRFDFFTRHLLGQAPPEWKAIEDAMKKGTAATTSLQ